MEDFPSGGSFPSGGPDQPGSPASVETPVGRELQELLTELQLLIEGDLWAGGTIMRGELPRTPIVDVLPPAGEAYGYRLVTLKGDGSTTPDIMHVCLRDSSAVWAWRISATG